MKKVLYGTSALVVAAAMTAAPAAAQIELGVGGYMNQWFGFADDDAPGDRNPTGLLVDGEIHFGGSFQHDNGLTFTARVELEAFSTGDQIDKVWAQVAGDFGTIRFGRVNDVASAFLVSAPQAGMGISTGWVTSFIPVATGADTETTTSTVGTIGGTITFTGTATFAGSYYVGTYQSNLLNAEAPNISYRSPRFAGFQIGVTYAPSVTVGGSTSDGALRAFTRSDADEDFQNAFSVAMNYSNEFNGVGISAAAGYSRVNNEGNGGAWQHFNVGMNISYAGFTVGGSYFNIFEDGTNGEVFCTCVDDTYYIDAGDNDWGFDVGATYSTGPWTFGIVYILTENNQEYTDSSPGDNGTTEQTFQAAGGGVSYAMGPGITLTGNLFWQNTEYDATDNGMDGTNFDDDDNEVEGFGGTVGMVLSF